ncbi:hypothetical protein [Thermococcus alcaliphilus]|uniref:hypothetical protein n=1 Tax=Thermococcus alcaliphilus TaxID=139207 RepID=UPI002090204C|nr:hypothetical protein [Thermococcus alcaliphilus]MCO6040398.1 hypothetical protein [Thermococcus alcaliphilus]
MNEKQKKILVFIMLLILTGPFAFLWLALMSHKEEPKVEIDEIQEKKDEFEWKSIWEE